MRLIKLIKRTFSSLVKWWDTKHCDYFECSIGDIVLLRKTPSNNQLLLTSRLLDVEDYLSCRNTSFPHQNTISYKAYGSVHKEEVGNAHFRSLIESYLKDGYHKESFITCDADLNLMDGNHRMGIHLYEQISEVNVRMVHRQVKAVRGFDWYYKVGLPTPFIEEIFNKYFEIQNWLIDSGNTFIALMESSNNDEINPYKDLSRLTTPLRFYSTSFKLDGPEWNGMNDITWGGVMLFSLDNPEYYSNNGQLFSKRIDILRQLFQFRYGDRIHIVLTNNCLEGKRLYDRISLFLNNQNMLQ